MIYYIQKGEYNMAALFILAILYFIACSGRNKKRKPDRLDIVHYNVMNDVDTYGYVYIEPIMLKDRKTLDRWCVDEFNKDTITDSKIMFYIALCNILPIPEGYDLETPNKELKTDSVELKVLMNGIPTRLANGYDFKVVGYFVYRLMATYHNTFCYVDRYIKYTWFGQTKSYILCLDNSREEEFKKTHEELKENIKRCLEDYNKVFNAFEGTKKELVEDMTPNNSYEYGGVQWIIRKLNKLTKFITNNIIDVGTTFWDWL